MSKLFSEYEYKDAMAMLYFANKMIDFYEFSESSVKQVCVLIGQKCSVDEFSENDIDFIVDVSNKVVKEYKELVQCNKEILDLEGIIRPWSRFQGFSNAFRSALSVIRDAYIADNGFVSSLSLDRISNLLLKRVEENGGYSDFVTHCRPDRYKYDRVCRIEKGLAPIKRYASISSTKIGCYAYQHNILCHEGYYHAIRTIYETLSYKQDLATFNSKCVDLTCLENYIQRALEKGVSKLKSVVKEYNYFDNPDLIYDKDNLIPSSIGGIENF